MSLLSKIGNGIKDGTKRIAKNALNSSRKYATGLAIAGALAISPTTPNAEAQQYGFTTWNTQLNGGITNTINSGDIINLYIVQGTSSNIYSDLIRFTVGSGNSMVNNLQLQGANYFNTSDGTVTNGFYNGKTLDTNPLRTYTTNMGSYFQTEIGLTAGQNATGTGDLMQLSFQAFNNGPTNIIVPVILGYEQVNGNWNTAAGTWSRTSPLYGDSIRAYVDVAPVIPEPSAGTLVAGGLLGLLALNRLKRKKN